MSKILQQEGYEPLQLESENSSEPRFPRRRLWLASSIVVAAALLFASVTVSKALHGHQEHNLEVLPDISPASKRGAGLLLTSDSQVLLLLRNSKNNNNTWGLPGGNVEADDTDLLVTAKREAQEEMGIVPEFTVLGQVVTRRGKHGKKHYTVFIGKMTADAKSSFQPQLNHEHSQWKWFDLPDAMQQSNLHPVVELMFSDTHKQQLLSAMGS